MQSFLEVLLDKNVTVMYLTLSSGNTAVVKKFRFIFMKAL